jgi:hypothetical protein
MNDTDGLEALRDYEQATLYLDSVKAGREHPRAKEEVADKHYRACLKRVLTLLLGRAVTDDEVVNFSDLTSGHTG